MSSREFPVFPGCAALGPLVSGARLAPRDATGALPRMLQLLVPLQLLPLLELRAAHRAMKIFVCHADLLVRAVIPREAKDDTSQCTTS